jgi:hypothetical protein
MHLNSHKIWKKKDYKQKKNKKLSIIVVAKKIIECITQNSKDNINFKLKNAVMKVLFFDNVMSWVEKTEKNKWFYHLYIFILVSSCDYRKTVYNAENITIIIE